MEKIQIKNHRFFETESGKPFFWLGDTAWELFKLSDREIDEYLETRAKQQFNVILSVMILNVPQTLEKGNDQAACAVQEGAFFTLKSLNEAFWKRVDRFVERCEELGLYAAILPCWGDKINKMFYHNGPEIFREEGAFAYGEWLGKRYAEKKNIFWVIGGDSPMYYSRHHRTVSALANGLRKGDGGYHLITYHPPGKQSSSKNFHEEAWLDFNMLQSSHSVWDMKTYEMVEHDLSLTPPKPCLDGEPCYEDHPFFFEPKNGFFDAYNVRKAAYWAVLGGACGHTYGHHCVWHFENEPEDTFVMTWRKALTRPGAAQMRHLLNLVLSRPYFERVPAQEMIVKNHEGSGYMAAARGQRYAFVYTPNGLPVRLKLGILLGDKLKASWYNVKNGGFEEIGLIENFGEYTFRPDMAGRGEDIVLVLDSMDREV